MNRSRTLLGIAGLAIAASVLTAGCATKGFVRRQVDDLRQGQAKETDRLDQSITDVKNSTDQAMQRAQIAYDTANDAREIALGKMGLEQIGEYTAQFGFDRDELDAGAMSQIDQAVGLLEQNPGTIVDIYGFADQTGDARYNLQLGQRRAEAVLRYIADKIPGSLSRLAAVSYGESKPVAANDSSAGRAQNRRVMVSVLEHKSSASPNETAPEGQPPISS